MKKDKCASCGKGGDLKTDFHNSDSGVNYRVMVCQDCANSLGSTLKDTPVYCPACGKKLGEHDLDYQSDVDDVDIDLAVAMGLDENDDDFPYSRFSYVYSMMDCPHCGFYASHGQKWYYNEATNCYDLPQPEGTPIAAEVERQRAKEAGQLDMFGEIP